jgi:hypothetical protein
MIARSNASASGSLSLMAASPIQLRQPFITFHSQRMPQIVFQEDMNAQVSTAAGPHLGLLAPRYPDLEDHVSRWNMASARLQFLGRNVLLCVAIHESCR